MGKRKLNQKKTKPDQPETKPDQPKTKPDQPETKPIQDEMEEECVVVLNKETSAFISCRSFMGVSSSQLKDFVRRHEFNVVTVSKNAKRQFGYVDLGSLGEVKRFVKELKGQDYKGSVIIADIVKVNQKGEKVEKKSSTDNICILDRLLCIRGVSKFVSKKVIVDLFKKVDSVIIPNQKASDLRDVLLVFRTPSHVAKAIQEFQGCELAGEKLVLEKLVSVPAEVKEGDLIDDVEEKKEKKLKNKKKDGETEKKEDDDDDDDDDMEADDVLKSESLEDSDGDDDDDDDDDGDDDEDDEEEEIKVQPPKKKSKKN